jgi:hypothetical protein
MPALHSAVPAITRQEAFLVTDLMPGTWRPAGRAANGFARSR